MPKRTDPDKMLERMLERHIEENGDDPDDPTAELLRWCIEDKDKEEAANNA